VEVLARLDAESAVINGEMVVTDLAGQSDFSPPQERYRSLTT